MSFLVAILVLVLIAGVILVVGAPLRSARARRQAGHGGSAYGGSANAAAAAPGGGPDQGSRLGREELEAAREAKYREIRDAELDYHTGKLAREDFEAIDRELRAEALEILNRLEQSPDSDLARADAAEPGDAAARGGTAAQGDGAGEDAAG